MSEPKRTIKRFPWWRCVEHAATLLVFFALVASGIPQKFHGREWAHAMVDWVGGINNMRTLHRVFGGIFVAQFALHILAGLWLIWVKKKIPAIVPTLQDFKDTVQSFKHSLWLTDQAPRFGRFEWKQKFEYWGMVVGGSLMIFTGVTLWMPAFVATFLPAELIPVSRVAHSNEAFLAFMVILFWHLYSVTISPEVFPLDTTMFTGKISEERMKHEHPLEYEEMVSRGEIPPPSEPSDGN